LEIELQIAPPSRLAAYARGRGVEFEIDREVAERFYASHAAGVEAFRAVGRAGHSFLERAVRFLTDDAGVRQFLVMGSSTSGRANVHEIAQVTAPESRAVYVLFDPLMLVYAHRLLHGTEGTTAYVRARMRDVDAILEQAATTLDLSEPVAVVMPANLSYVRSPDRAARIVDGFMDPLAAGSHLLATHHASDLLVDQVGPVYRRLAELAAQRQAWEVAPRSRAEIAALLARLDLVEPGVVPIERWRPTGGADEPVKVAVYGAVGRK
jgi:hypothetical protein